MMPICTYKNCRNLYTKNRFLNIKTNLDFLLSFFYSIYIKHKRRYPPFSHTYQVVKIKIVIKFKPSHKIFNNFYDSDFYDQKFSLRKLYVSFKTGFYFYLL